MNHKTLHGASVTPHRHSHRGRGTSWRAATLAAAAATAVVTSINTTATAAPTSGIPDTTTPTATAAVGGVSGGSPVEGVKFDMPGFAALDEPCSYKHSPADEQVRLHCDQFPATFPKDAMRIIMPAITSVNESYTLAVTAHDFGRHSTFRLEARRADGGADTAFWSQDGLTHTTDLDCATLPGGSTALAGRGCEYRLRLDNWFSVADLTITVTHHPGPGTCAATSSTTATPASRSAGDGSIPMLGAPAQVGDGWEDSWISEPFHSLHDACAEAQRVGSPAVLMVEEGNDLVYFVARPEARGHLELPPTEYQYRLYLLQDGVCAVLFYPEDRPDEYPGVLLHPNPQGHRWYLDDEDSRDDLQLWLGDSPPNAPNPVPTQTDASDLTADSRVESAPIGAACDPKRDTCVFGIAAGPDQQGATPLTKTPIHPENSPNHTAAAPAATIKNVVIIAPSDNPNLNTLNVTTEDRNHTLHHWLVRAGRLFGIPNSETLRTVTSETR